MPPTPTFFLTEIISQSLRATIYRKRFKEKGNYSYVWVWGPKPLSEAEVLGVPSYPAWDPTGEDCHLSTGKFLAPEKRKAYSETLG